MKEFPAAMILVTLLASAAAASSHPAIVDVRATAPLATEPDGSAGAFTIFRGGDTNADITVPFTLGGSAKNGADYNASVSNAVTLAAGQTSTNISITPIAEPDAKARKSVTLTLDRTHFIWNATNAYFVGYPVRAVVDIVYNYTNAAPTVELVSPTNNAVYFARPNIALTALAGDSKGWTASVTFLADGAAIGAVTNNSFAPWPWRGRDRFQFVWTNAPAGAHSLEAVAVNNSGQSATSAVVAVTVTTNLPDPHARVISPWDGAQLAEGAPVNIFAAAGETNGAINTVEFLGDGASLGVVTNACLFSPAPRLVWRPYYFRWTNAPPGSNEIQVIAADANGSRATSAPVSINVVTNAPIGWRWHNW